MCPDVRGADELGITIPQTVDGVPTSPPIRDRLEICRISIAPQHPTLGTAEPPVSFFIRVDGSELILEIISHHPLIRGDPGGVRAVVQGLDG